MSGKEIASSWTRSISQMDMKVAMEISFIKVLIIRPGHMAFQITYLRELEKSLSINICVVAFVYTKRAFESAVRAEVIVQMIL